MAIAPLAPTGTFARRSRHPKSEGYFTLPDPGFFRQLPLPPLCALDRTFAAFLFSDPRVNASLPMTIALWPKQFRPNAHPWVHGNPTRTSLTPLADLTLSDAVSSHGTPVKNAVGLGGEIPTRTWTRLTSGDIARFIGVGTKGVLRARLSFRRSEFADAVKTPEQTSLMLIVPGSSPDAAVSSG
jgi:hypothetical protein